MSDNNIPIYDLFSPTDFRYSVKDLIPYLSEEAFVKYKLKVEEALAKVLAKNGICSEDVVDEIIKASSQIKAQDVYIEERKIKHDVKALVNMIRSHVSDKAKPFVHATATSYDVVDTANTLRYKNVTKDVILPDMITFEKILIKLARREMNTLQIGRTHGQHAVPITFGFAIAQYVNRWGNRILKVKEATLNLVGKFSGAVGAYNASSLFVTNPENFEREILEILDLRPSMISTQIVPPEPTLDYVHSIVSSLGVLANYSRDMRNLQRSEIGEVGEPFEKEQVGSSTMPQKRNPINFENVESSWKKFMPFMITMYLDQISEHQRDLTNSLSQRYTPELLVIFVSSLRRMIRTTNGLIVDKVNLERNFASNRDKIISEPLHILLTFNGHPNSHKYIMKLIKKSYRTKTSLLKIVLHDDSLKPYVEKFTESQLELLKDPTKYVGIASQKVSTIVNLWEKRMCELR